METTLMYLTGNDSRLAEDLISALSALFISFFSAEKEDENEAEPISSVQIPGGTPEPGSPGLCPPVDDGPARRDSTPFKKEHYRLAGRKNTSA